MTNITELVVYVKQVDTSIGEFTGLVRPGILSEQCTTDFAHALTKLHLLEELDLLVIDDMLLSGHMFSCMARLKRLFITLPSLQMEDDFFPVLGSLEKLTSLELDSRVDTEWDTCQHMSKITLLSNLRELILRHGTDGSRQRANLLRNFDQNSFPKLRTLHISSLNYLDEAYCKPQTKFPRLNSVFFHAY